MNRNLDSLEEAIEDNDLKLLKKLLKEENIPSDDKELVQLAVDCKNIDALKVLLNYGIVVSDIDLATFIKNEFKPNSLNSKAYKAIELLLKNGVNPNYSNYYQSAGLVSPIFVARDCGQIDVVKLLLKHGAEIPTWPSFFDELESSEDNTKYKKLFKNHDRFKFLNNKLPENVRQTLNSIESMFDIDNDFNETIQKAFSLPNFKQYMIPTFQKVFNDFKENKDNSLFKTFNLDAKEAIDIVKTSEDDWGLDSYLRKKSESVLAVLYEYHYIREDIKKAIDKIFFTKDNIHYILETIERDEKGIFIPNENGNLEILNIENESRSFLSQYLPEVYALLNIETFRTANTEVILNEYKIQTKNFPAEEKILQTEYDSIRDVKEDFDKYKDKLDVVIRYLITQIEFGIIIRKQNNENCLQELLEKNPNQIQLESLENESDTCKRYFKSIIENAR